MPYAFAPGVSACIADGRLVILNVAADRYLMLPPDTEQSLRRLIGGSQPRPTDIQVYERLCTSGLILSRSRRANLPLCRAVAPRHSLVDDGWPQPRLQQVISAGLRTFAACSALSVRSLQRVLRRVETVPVARPDDFAGTLRIAAAFAELRFCVRALDRCLPLSVALAAAGKRRHRAAHLVLGVRCDPFCAHAWVQLDDLVLNDRLDTVNSFTPVLVV